MKVKKVPLRTCVVTHEQRPKKDLVRVVRNNEGVVSVDLNGKAPGRGAYLILEEDVILKAQKSHALDKKLEATVPDLIYEQLLGLIKHE